MSASTIFIIGCVVLSMAISYAWWVRVRVVLLREDLFEIRDWLFDQAVAHSCIDDPGYRDTRDLLNGLIRFAHIWSLPVLLSVVIQPPMSHGRPSSTCVEFDAKIREAMHRAGSRFARYLIFESLTGLFLVVVGLLVSPWVSGYSWLKTRIERLIESGPDAPSGFARC